MSRRVFPTTVPRGEACLMCLAPKEAWHNHPTCTDCGALIQIVRVDGEDVERCPWATGPRDCGKPFRRLLGVQ